MILEKNNLQTAQEWTKSFIELIASYVHLKTGNHLRSHLRAIMALDHRRLIRPGKKIRPNFLRSTSLLCKILPTNLGAYKPTFYTIYTSHLRWNSSMRHCFYHADLGQKAVFHNTNLHSFNIQDDGSKGGHLAKPLKNFQNHLYCHSVLTFVVRAGWVFEWTLTESRNKEFIFYFLFNSLQVAFWVLLQAMFTERLKTIGTAIKITRETTNNQ